MKIVPSVFNDDRDKLAAVAVVLCSMFFSFLPGLVVLLFLKEKVSANTYEISKGFFNFELLLFLISLIVVIPLIGWIAGAILIPVMAIFNIVIIVIDLCAIAKGAEVKVPEWFSFL